MGESTFESYRAEFLGRHANRRTSAIATAGDVLWLAAVPVGVASKSVRRGAGVFALGTVVALVAHLFQKGTVVNEVKAIVTHPWWAARAEVGRVLHR